MARGLANVLAVFLLLAVAACGWYALGQIHALRDDVIAAVTSAPQPIASLSIEYTDRDGNPHTISVTGAPNEPPEQLAARLKEQLIATEVEFPRRR